MKFPPSFRRLFAPLASGIFVFVLAADCHAQVISAQAGVYFKVGHSSTDSFDSADVNLSTRGFYDPSKTSTNGDVICVSGMASLDVAFIDGKLLLGSGASYGLSTNGSISGAIETDLNLTMNHVAVPQVAWLPVARVPDMIIDGTAYQYVFVNSGDYSVSELSGNMYVATNTHVKLLVRGTNASPGTIRVAGADANAGQLTIYAGVPTFTLGGMVTVDGGNAQQFTYLGTTNNTNVAVTANSAIIGTIFAPEANFRIGAGGSAILDFVGCVAAKTVTNNGHFNFHFDENLWRVGLSLPEIITHPQSQTVAAGQDVSFGVEARGNVAYQWKKDGVDIPGASASVLEIANLDATAAGTYVVVVSNAWGVQVSRPAELTVQGPPVITRQPASLAAPLGGSVTFSVTAVGPLPLSYSWRTNGIAILDQTNATLTVTNVQPSNVADYTVLVGNSNGSVLSDVARLTLANAPTIGGLDFSPGTFALTFPTEPGPVYVVEFKTSLDAALWQVLTNIVGDGTPATITDNGLTNATKFYRLRLH